MIYKVWCKYDKYNNAYSTEMIMHILRMCICLHSASFDLLTLLDIVKIVYCRYGDKMLLSRDYSSHYVINKAGFQKMNIHKYHALNYPDY